MEEFDWRFLRQTRLITLRYLVPFCMCWWSSSGRKAKFAKGRIKPNPSVFALVSDYKKRIINRGFLQKRSVCFYSLFHLKWMRYPFQGLLKNSFFYTALEYSSKVVWFQERGYFRDAQLENCTGRVRVLAFRCFDHCNLLFPAYNSYILPQCEMCRQCMTKTSQYSFTVKYTLKLLL